MGEGEGEREETEEGEGRVPGATFTVAADDNDEVHATAALGIWPLPPRSRSGTGKEESVPAG
jgi:hypothetical protein